MATFTAIKNRGGGRGALGSVLRYTQQEEKTLWEGQRLVSGWNCTAQSALSEMQLTKERYRKTDGRQYYHFVQSFAETDDLTPQEVHAIGLELAQREFPDFEVLVATHIDTDHLHSHLIVNSVSFQDGRKLHQSAADLQAHRLASDQSASLTVWRSCRRPRNRSSRNEWAAGSTAPPPRDRAGSSG